MKFITVRKSSVNQKPPAENTQGIEVWFVSVLFGPERSPVLPLGRDAQLCSEAGPAGCTGIEFKPLNGLPPPPPAGIAKAGAAS